MFKGVLEQIGEALIAAAAALLSPGAVVRLGWLLLGVLLAACPVSTPRLHPSLC